MQTFGYLIFSLFKVLRDDSSLQVQMIALLYGIKTDLSAVARERYTLFLV